MGKVIEFKTKTQQREEDTTVRLVTMANEFDELIMKYVTDPQCDPRELVGVLSHRLGSLISHLDEKDELWYVCQKVVKKQAQIVDG